MHKKHMSTIVRGVCFEMLASASHTSHKSERYLLLCPSLDNVPVLAFENPKSIEHHFIAVCCFLNSHLVGDCGCFRSILAFAVL